MESESRALTRLYAAIDGLEAGLGGTRHFNDCTGRQPWPSRGVYFFFEPGEHREGVKGKLRVVRVGTHAVSANSRSTLWDRLKTHKGNAGGGGNHRSSIFRQHAGFALMASGRLGVDCPSWGIGMVKPNPSVLCEDRIEREVSSYLGTMSVLWIAVDDQPGPRSDRAFLERNIIALLACRNPQKSRGGWLGDHSPNENIRLSRLWNVDHIKRNFDERALNVFEDYVDLAIRGETPPQRSLAPQGWARWEMGSELPLEDIISSSPGFSS
jgi:hypothetical protein